MALAVLTTRQGAVANTSPDAGNCNRLFEVGPWMWRRWRYGRGQPRKVSVAKADARRQERQSQANHKAAKTLKLHREERRDEFYTRQLGRLAAEADWQ